MTLSDEPKANFVTEEWTPINFVLFMGDGMSRVTLSYEALGVASSIPFDASEVLLSIDKFPMPLWNLLPAFMRSTNWSVTATRDNQRYGALVSLDFHQIAARGAN